MASTSGFTRVQGSVVEMVEGGSVRSRQGVYWWVNGEPTESHIGRTLRELHREGAIGLEREGERDEWGGVLVVLTEVGRVRMSEGQRSVDGGDDAGAGS